jgi:hypothetical protein
MSEERVFFQKSGIIVTNSRFVVDSQTFAMRHITSVQTKKETPPLTVPGYLMLLGIALALIGFVSGGVPLGVIGIAALLVGVYLAWNKKDTFKVVLTTSAGEVVAYEDHDGQLISEIVRSLNDAMAASG